MRKQNRIKIRKRLLLVLLIIAVIPLLTVIFIFGKNFYRYLNKLSEEAYLTMIEQVSININYDIDRCHKMLDEVFLADMEVKNLLEDQQFHTAIEELNYDSRLGETLKSKLFLNINGAFSFIQFDRTSIIENGNYKLSSYSSGEYKVDIQSLRNDPLYLDLAENSEKTIAFGMLSKGVLIGYNVEQRPVLLYPIRDEKKAIVKLVLILLPLNYHTKLYIHLEKVKLGTLFISDLFGNVLNVNHPSTYDDFEYDKKNESYLDSGKEPLDRGMTLADYNHLILDINVINQPEILAFLVDSGLKTPFLKDSRTGIKNIIIKYNKKNYMAVGRVDPKLGTRFLFIIPEYHVLRPAQKFIRIILGMSLSIFVVIFAAVVFSYWKIIIPIEKRYVGLEEKNLYFMNLAHEIKTPLTLIRNYLDLYIQKSGICEELEVVRQNISKLEKDMVNILDYRKLEEGKMIYENEKRSNLSYLLHLKEKLYTQVALKKEIKLFYQIKDGIFVKADPLALDRVINNLIDNALKYTPKYGEITVCLIEGKDKVELSISDTGVGISKQNLKKIFLPYSQITNPQGSSNGVGLGLFITYGIIKELKGNITVSSKEGQGSIFTVKLKKWNSNEEKGEKTEKSLFDRIEGNFVSSPAIYEKKRAKKEAEKTIVSGRANILILEDNVDLLYYLEASLEDEYNVFSAENGKAGMELLSKIRKPDLIISDLMMPELDGYQFLNYLSQEENFQDIPFIFLSAASDHESKLKAFLKGAVDFISKPFSIELLKARIESLLNYQKIKNELYEKDKYATMGMLLGGISHEIFNPLLGIYAPLENLEVLLERVEFSQIQEKGIKYIKNIECNLNRIESIVKSLKILYYNREFLIEEIDLEKVIQSVSSIFVNKLSDDIKLEYNIDEGFRLNGNQNVVVQILINLIKNSIDAMKNRKGKIVVSAVSSESGNYLTVSDTGAGIKQEELAMVFNAFFTTKEAGKGTGLGLYLVKDLVGKMGWKIEVSSKVGEGSTFKILF